MTDDTKPETPDSPAEVAPPPADANEPTSPSPDELRALARERDEYRDLTLRKTAELDNYRKRIDREREAVGQRAAADLITELKA